MGGTIIGRLVEANRAIGSDLNLVYAYDRYMGQKSSAERRKRLGDCCWSTQRQMCC